MTSPDGTTWTSRTSAGSNTYTWNSLTWAPTIGKFIAIAGTGNTGDQVMTSDLLSPTISSISSGTPGATSATITWTTDLSSSSQVNYGLTSGYGSSTTLDSTLVTSHSVSLSGLANCTTYHYQVSSTYVSQNTLSSDNTFTTTNCSSAPTVTSSAASSITNTTATLNGNITATNGATPTIRGFYYGLTNSYGTTTTESGSFSAGVFTSALTSLVCNTTYHFQSYATNSAGTGTSSPDLSFTTSSCPSAGGHFIPSITPVEIKNTTSLLQFYFTRSMGAGLSGSDVMELQKFLNTHDALLAVSGPGSPNNETAFFGKKTILALKHFQEAHANEILVPLRLEKGTGFFGPSTMKFVNQIISDGK
jgi:hypothetical protein